jgi:hypothetical protein
MEKSKIIVLAAESGIGKSSLMAATARDLEGLKHPGLHVFFHFVGCTNLSNYVERLFYISFCFYRYYIGFSKNICFISVCRFASGLWSQTLPTLSSKRSRKQVLHYCILFLSFRLSYNNSYRIRKRGTPGLAENHSGEKQVIIMPIFMYLNYKIKIKII